MSRVFLKKVEKFFSGRSVSGVPALSRRCGSGKAGNAAIKGYVLPCLTVCAISDRFAVSRAAKTDRVLLYGFGRIRSCGAFYGVSGAFIIICIV